jgi:antitoxin (DNA-binding transcriptional repressor) of toxin-antitoxin stability system
MITVSKGTLQKKVQEYFRKVEESGEEIIVTSNKIPVIKIAPIKKTRNVDDVFADIRGKIKYYKDILTPETEEWGDI